LKLGERLRERLKDLVTMRERLRELVTMRERLRELVTISKLWICTCRSQCTVVQ